MKPTYTLRSLTLGALMISAAAFPATSFAGSDTDAYKTQDTMLKTADEALATITDVQEARMALFENDLTQAKAKVEEARTALMNAEADLTPKLMKDFTLADSKTNFLPFDMSMSLTEGFKATEENKLALQKAYGLFESAAPDDAIEVLRVASIDIQVSAAMLPYDTTLTALDNAIGNIEDGDYFAANLDLKGITDSVVVRQFGIDAIPVQGDVM